MSRYLVPKETTRIENKVSNSRFIATVGRVSTVEEARDFLKTVREEMPDASHHVYAYKVGYGKNVTEGMSDDGEPSGTSGPPSLAVLRGADVGDTVIVITRYFGGTKLGTGGLVTAYSQAAKDVLAAMPTEEKVTRKVLSVTLPYNLFERVKLVLPEYEGLLQEERFDAEITLLVSFPEEKIAGFIGYVKDLSSGSVNPEVIA